MKNTLSLLIFIPAMFAACLTTRRTQIEYREDSGCMSKQGGYQHTRYFPFRLERPFWVDWKDKLSVTSFLVLADTGLKISISKVQPYLTKNNDTIMLQEEKTNELFSYPDIINEPEINIQFVYKVFWLLNKKEENITEHIHLFRCKSSFKSTH